MKKYEALKIENQLCFPLYACAKEVVKKYKPYLEQIDLTYTQYITMMVLWEYGEMNVKELGERLYLDSGTLTPLLKKLEKKGLVSRRRSKKDERNLIVTITEEGTRLQEKASGIPSAMGSCINLGQEEALTLYRLLYKILGKPDQQTALSDR
ncbi:MAG: MarR family transcriptional regulator [Clostridiaceae bacterium]|nr:MarR family transcriptional regulator [Clostridiaceae bacterium]